MMMPPQWEGLAQERMLSWEREVKYLSLLAQLPKKPPRWRRWTGASMVWVGTVLMRLGERMAQRPCREGVSMIG